MGVYEQQRAFEIERMADQLDWTRRLRQSYQL
jgi:hypothetical protein